jgi:hypothetical protein
MLGYQVAHAQEVPGMRVSLVLLFAALAAIIAWPAEAGSIGWIKANCVDGQVVEAEGIVAAEFADCVYVEDIDGSAGIRLRGSGAWEGLLYIFDSDGSTTGLKLQTGPDGEKELVLLPNTPICIIFPETLPVPFGMPNRSVGGG